MSDERLEEHPPATINQDVTSRDELTEFRHEDVEEVRNPWRIEETPIFGFWKPAVVLLILGILAMILLRGLF